MQEANFPATVVLPADHEATRRIAFVIGRVTNALGLPWGSPADVLLQVAMEQPEKVTPEEYSVVYMMRSQEALQ